MFFVRSPTPLPSFQETYTVQRYTRQELQGLGIKMDEECYENPVYSCTTAHYPTEFPTAVPYHEHHSQQQQQHHHHHPQHHHQQQQQAPHHHPSYFSTESPPTPATAVIPPSNHHRQESSYGVPVTVPMVYGAPSAIASVAPVAPTDLCPNVDTVVVGTTRSRRASLPTQRSESAR